MARNEQNADGPMWLDGRLPQSYEAELESSLCGPPHKRLKTNKRVVFQGHKKQRLVVREGVAGPGVHAPGLASGLNAGGLWLDTRRPTFKKQARGLGNSRTMLEHRKRH